MRRAGKLEEERQDVLEPEFLAGIKAELVELRRVLTPDTGSEDG